jgi:acyl-coenzyme A synthetase/AMP-(fatty) acid ligase
VTSKNKNFKTEINLGLNFRYRIGPFEVESVLLEHASVAESAVVGSPDIERGFVVKAFIVLTPIFQEKIENNIEEEENLIKEIQVRRKFA